MQYTNIPHEMQAVEQWILWRIEIDKDGNKTKVPYSPLNWKMKASTTNSATWSSFSQAVAVAELANMGIGFVFTEEDEFFGIDIDAMSKVDSSAREAAIGLRTEIDEQFKTYCEKSPSGTGWHYIGFGKLPDGATGIKDVKHQVEVYDKGRFFTVTGNQVSSDNSVNNCYEELTDLALALSPMMLISNDGTYETELDSRSVEDIIGFVYTWKNGQQFKFLMGASHAEILAFYNNDHSSADFALTNYIAQATNDVEKAVEIFRRSPLWRGTKGGYTTENSYINSYLIKNGFAQVWNEKAIKERERNEAAKHGAEIAKNLIVKSEESPIKNELPISIMGRKRWEDIETEYPEGFAGYMMQQIEETMHNPNKTYVTWATLAYFSGMLGRAYKMNGDGINLFMLLAGLSASGKSQAWSSINKLISQINPYNCSPQTAVMIGGAASVQGIADHSSTDANGKNGHPQMVFRASECGEMLAQMLSDKNEQMRIVKAAIHDFYDTSQIGGKWRPPASRASTKAGVKTIECLSVSLAWDTTYEQATNFSSSDFESGLMSRMLVVYSKSPIGDINENKRKEYDPAIIAHLNGLFSQIDALAKIDFKARTDVSLVSGLKHIEISMTDDVQRLMRELMYECHAITRKAQMEELPIHYMGLSRVQMNVSRIAGVMAVLNNSSNPVIDTNTFNWALNFVLKCSLTTVDLIDCGEVGATSSKETAVLVNKAKLYIKHNPKELGIPHSQLMEQAIRVSPYRLHTKNPRKHVADVIADMLIGGQIDKVTEQTGGRDRTVYVMTDHKCWQ